MPRIPWLLLPLLGLACSPSLPSDLGDHPLDRERLVDSPALLHLATALDGADDLTVEDLFRQRPAYAQAPNPAALLAEMQTSHRALPALGPAEGLRVLSFNTGLLDRWYPFTTVQVPFVDDRRERLPGVLLADGWDLLLLQEVWDTRDVEVFEAEAAERGYRSYAGSDLAHEEHGLLILVREDLIDPDGPDERGEHIFELQRDIETFPGPGVARGFITWRFRLADAGVVLTVMDTHTTAFPELASVREAQTRRLGIVARDVPDDEVVLLAGDINAGAYYPYDTFGEVDGEPVGDWWRNAQAYALLLHYGGFYDVHAAVGQARDVEVMDQLPPFGPEYFAQPLADRSRCTELAGVFTATDCNSLYFRQYAATESPARIDHLMIRDPQGVVRVESSAVVYDSVTSEGYELSDHYGVGARIWIGHQ